MVSSGWFGFGLLHHRTKLKTGLILLRIKAGVEKCGMFSTIGVLNFHKRLFHFAGFVKSDCQRTVDFCKQPVEFVTRFTKY